MNRSLIVGALREYEDLILLQHYYSNTDAMDLQITGMLSNFFAKSSKCPTTQHRPNKGSTSVKALQFYLRIKFWTFNTEETFFTFARVMNFLSWIKISVADPYPYVFGPPWSGSFYHQANIVRKALITRVPFYFCVFFATFYLWKIM